MYSVLERHLTLNFGRKSHEVNKERQRQNFFAYIAYFKKTRLNQGRYVMIARANRSMAMKGSEAR